MAGDNDNGVGLVETVGGLAVGTGAVVGTGAINAHRINKLNTAEGLEAHNKAKAALSAEIATARENKLKPIIDRRPIRIPEEEPVKPSLEKITEAHTKSAQDMLKEGENLGDEALKTVKANAEKEFEAANNAYTGLQAAWKIRDQDSMLEHESSLTKWEKEVEEAKKTVTEATKKQAAKIVDMEAKESLAPAMKGMKLGDKLGIAFKEYPKTSIGAAMAATALAIYAGNKLFSGSDSQVDRLAAQSQGASAAPAR